ncbi:MAG: potassium transporter TrkG, partial [Eubacteriales bacterium]
TLALTLTDNLPFLPSAFEVASAMATVGLSMGLTSRLNPLSSVIIIILMFLGRVGILSFSIAFANKTYQANKVRYPTADIMVG